jgi:integrase
MPKQITPLSDLQVNKAKPQTKETKLFDGGGLFLLVSVQKIGPDGKPLPASKSWRFKYRFGGKEKLLSFGTYPQISLADARQRREEAKRLLANGVDPAEIKKAQKAAVMSSNQNSFEVIARAWHAGRVEGWSDSHAKTTLERLQKNIFPWLGAKPVNEIRLSDIKPVLHRIEERAPESARRMLVALNMIFRYCVVSEYIERSPLEGLKPKDIMKKEPIQQNFPALILPQDVAPFLRAIDDFQGTFIVKCALQLAPLVFARPGDLRHAEWSEIDFEAAEWKIPVAKMKLSKKEKAKQKGDFHYVPLSRQAIEILKSIQPLTGRSPYVFPGARSYHRPMSEAALTAALHRMGYKGEMTWHGFRAMARTMLRQNLHFHPEYIELQLAHATKSQNGTAYDRVSFLPERRQMMETWAEYLDGLKSGAKVIPLRKAE